MNTLFSCLPTLHPDFSFVPRWRPKFITELAAGDRCHLNGMAMDAGQPRFVMLMAESNAPAGWRPTKRNSGAVVDVSSGEPVARGLAMPHSPRWYDRNLWVLNSGLGTLEVVDLATGGRNAVASMPGYTRGLAFDGPFAFVGLSRIRETSVFGGVPIAEHRHELKCGIGIVDLRTGQPVAPFQFETGVEEICDVQVVPGSRCLAITGPRPDQDNAKDIWIVPRPDQVIVDKKITVSTADKLVPTNFFAFYQGENDRTLNANLGHIYRGLDLSCRRDLHPSANRRRVGFLSAYFRDHTIGRLNLAASNDYRANNSKS